MQVGWERRQTPEGPRLIVTWTETGIEARGDEQIGTGFGRSLIEKALPYQLGGETEYRLTRDALHCTISIPLLKPREATAP